MNLVEYTKQFTSDIIEQAKVDIKAEAEAKSRVQRLFPPMLVTLLKLANKKGPSHDSDDYKPEFDDLMKFEGYDVIEDWINSDFKYNHFQIMSAKGPVATVISCCAQHSKVIKFDFSSKKVIIDGKVMSSIKDIKSNLIQYYQRQLPMFKDDRSCSNWLEWIISELKKL